LRGDEEGKRFLGGRRPDGTRRGSSEKKRELEEAEEEEEVIDPRSDEEGEARKWGPPTGV
jgi:hypothetical protein